MNHDIPAKIADAILDALAASPVPEDPRHGKNTLTWLLRLEPDASLALQLSALGHDMERSVPPRTRQADHPDYNAFKAAHARRSAVLLTGLLQDLEVAPEVIRKTGHLVRRHEFGGDWESDLLVDADSISFFDVNLPLYYQREGWEESLRRARWGWHRLSPRAREQVSRIRYPSSRLNHLLKQVCQHHR